MTFIREHRWSYQPLVPALTAAAAGICLDHACSLPVWAWLLTAGTFSGLWPCFWLGSAGGASTAASLMLVACLFGSWHNLYWNYFPQDELSRQLREEPVAVCLEVVAEGQATVLQNRRSEHRLLSEDNFTRLTVRIRRLRGNGRWIRASGRARLTIRGARGGIEAGDVLRVHARGSLPPTARNPGEFDLLRHERGNRCLCRLSCDYPQCVVLLRRGSAWNPRRWLGRVRAGGEQLLLRYVGRQQGALAAALLLGEREHLEQEQTHKFFITGVIHLLAISGLHVGILASGFWLLRRLGVLSRRASLISAAVFVCGYAALTDGRPPVVRAAILLVAFCWGRYLGRRVNAMNCLAAAGLLLLLHSPRSLFQPGVQLSFVAVATLIQIGGNGGGMMERDPLLRLIDRARPWPLRVGKKWFRSLLATIRTTSLVWIVTAPLVLFHFHLAALAGLALNPILAAPIAAALFSGLGVLIFGAWLPPLGWLCGRACCLSLQAVDACIEFAVLFRATFWAPAPRPWWTVGFYLLLAGWSQLGWLKSRPWTFPALIIGWVGVGACSEALIRWEREQRSAASLTCTFLSVGHGTCVVLELPGDQLLMYDAGSLAAARGYDDHRIVNYLWHQRRGVIDHLVLSHADVDHFAATPGLLDRFQVGEILVSPTMFSGNSSALARLASAIDRADTRLRAIQAGQQLEIASGVCLEVLHPAAPAALGNDNANSIVLSIDFQGWRILLPGDLEGEGMRRVLRLPPRRCHVLMAPHHGSARSAPRQFAEWTTPRWVVISSGGRQTTTLAEDVFRRRGARALHTQRDGAIRVVLTSNELRVDHWMDDQWRNVGIERRVRTGE